MGMAAAINAAETALHQGVDLYAEQATRLTAAMEFHAKLVAAGAAQPGEWLCSGKRLISSPPLYFVVCFVHELMTLRVA